MDDSDKRVTKLTNPLSYYKFYNLTRESHQFPHHHRPQRAQQQIELESIINGTSFIVPS